MLYTSLSTVLIMDYMADHSYKLLLKTATMSGAIDGYIEKFLLENEI